MTFSPDRPAPPEDLPPALPAMWRMFQIGFRAQPRLLAVAFTLTVLAAFPEALLALWLKLLGDGLVEDHRGLVRIAAMGLALAAVGSWFLMTVSARIQRRFRDRMTIVLESHVAELQVRATSIELHERPEYLDRLEVLRSQVFVLDHLYMSIFTTIGWVLRLAITTGLLVSIHPALLLVGVAALPTVLAASWRPAVEQRANERAAADARFSRHVFELSLDVAASKEIRVMGTGEYLERLRDRAWRRWHAVVSRARWVSSLWYTGGWIVFALGYVGGVIFVASGPQSSPGTVLLVLAAGAQLSRYIGAAMGEIGFLRGIWLDGSRRLVWLERYVAAQEAVGDLPAPDRLHEGIRLDHVSFAYPGTDRLVLEDINLVIPAGSVTAVVGENGAGKSTLVKLLGRLYEPTTGTIMVDGTRLSQISATSWRERLAGAFQDFFRFELPAQETVGVGDVGRINDRSAVETALERADAGDVVVSLPAGLETQLGPDWPAGVGVSFGQWQKLALARGLMRDEPLLLVLDEPTAALDAETEHSLFERFARVAAEDPPAEEDPTAGEFATASNGRITLLISHRFSTVRMADRIVVLDGSRLVEVGTHRELMEAGGKYAELHDLQAAGYR